MLMMWEICICARPSECKRVVVCYSYILSTKKSIYNSVWFISWRWKLHLPNRVSDQWFTLAWQFWHLHNGECASTQGKPLLYSILFWWMCHDFTAMQGAKVYKFNKKNRVTQINVPKAVPVAVRILTTKNSFSLLTRKGNLSRSVVLDVVIALGWIINPIQISLIYTVSSPEKERLLLYFIPLFWMKWRRIAVILFSINTEEPCFVLALKILVLGCITSHVIHKAKGRPKWQILCDNIFSVTVVYQFALIHAYT